jgi:N-6 DNA Methylase
VPTPADLRKQFIKAFESLARHRDKHDVLVDFLELAVCAIRKRTVPPGPAADALEEKYMAVVRRNKPEDVRAMPELLAITTLAVQEGGCDFLGQVVGDLELMTGHMGQFFTPYDLSRMMAELTLDTVDEIIAEQGFVTVQEPACGAGGMIIAAADVLARKGFDIGQCLYVDAIDISPLCFCDGFAPHKLLIRFVTREQFFGPPAEKYGRDDWPGADEPLPGQAPGEGYRRGDRPTVVSMRDRKISPTGAGT